MKKLIGEPRVIQFSKASGRSIQIDIRDLMISIMNKGFSANALK